MSDDGDPARGETADRFDERPERQRSADLVEFLVHAGDAVASEVSGPAMTEEVELALARFLDEDPRIPEDLRVRVSPAGRSTVGPALLFELLGTRGARVGEVEADRIDARRTTAAWQFLREKLPEDRLPLLSLGAVRLLCVGDLEHRLGTLEGVRLLWCEQVDGDRSYLDDPSEDLFAVVFARGTDLWCYFVDAIGQIVHFGEAARARQPW